MLLSSLLGIMSNSWIMLWIFMEINTICMCSLMSMEAKKNSSQPPSNMMYLVVQLISSAILLSVYWVSNTPLSSMIMMSCLLMKAGCWPLHLWYMMVLQKLDLKMKTMKLIMTWQKLLPFFMLSFFSDMKILILMIAVFNLTLPTLKLKKNMSFKSLMILSSIFNTAWFMLSIMDSLFIFIIYFIIYSASLILTLDYFESLKTKISQTQKTFWETMMIVGNMSGIPPSIIFFSKIIIIMILLHLSCPKGLMFIMLLINCFFIYHYSWSTYQLFFSSNTKSQLNKMKNKSMNFSMMCLFNAVSFLIFITLDFPIGFTLMG